MLPACPFLRGFQDIDFAALYKAYDDELMAWKAVIDERHRGEKKSSGLSHLLTSPLYLRLTIGSRATFLFRCRRSCDCDGDHARSLVSPKPKHAPEHITAGIPPLLPSRLLGAPDADANHYVSLSACSTTAASLFVVAACS